MSFCYHQQARYQKSISPVILEHYSYVPYSSVCCVLLGHKEAHPSLPIFFFFCLFYQCYIVLFQIYGCDYSFSFICLNFLGCIHFVPKLNEY